MRTLHTIVYLFRPSAFVVPIRDAGREGKKTHTSLFPVKSFNFLSLLVCEDIFQNKSAVLNADELLKQRQIILLHT